MSSFSSLTFSIAGVPGEISPGHPLWQKPLAGRSSEFSGVTSPIEDDWTVGDYFTAARAFISMPKVLDRLTEPLDLASADPVQWDVILELQKHGAFYHPIKMTVSSEGIPGRESFALNGAVSDHGRELARRESRHFSLLARQLPSLTPGVYAAGEVNRPKGQAGFLLVQWLEGYYEFHGTEERGMREVAVWRPGADTLYLSMDQAMAAYQNIAESLTLAYDPATGGQVLLWHHGAGDFIVAPDSPSLPVKLITVREYGCMVDEEVLDQGPLPGLLFFFLNLCLRMQLDRLDGVGRPVMLGPGVLAATVRGFLKALGGGNRGDAAAETAWEFFSEFSRNQIRSILEQMLEVWPTGHSERDLVAGEIGEFAGQIRGFFKTGRFSDFY